MHKIKDLLTLLLVILGILSLIIFNYSLFYLSQDNKETGSSELNAKDSQEVCFKIKTMNIDNDGIYLEQSGV